MNPSVTNEAEVYEWQDCRGEFNGSELIIKNSCIERKWKIQNGQLYAASFQNLKTSTEWLSQISDLPAPALTPSTHFDHKDKVGFEVESPFASPTSEDSMLLTLTIESSAHGKVIYQFRIFPDSPGISIRHSVENLDGTASETTDGSRHELASGVETAKKKKSSLPPQDTVELFYLRPQHLRFIEVRLQDQSDAHNELSQEREWLLHPSEAHLALKGNLFFVENTLSGEGLAFLKEAPLPHARALKNDFDLKIHRQGIALYGNGISPENPEGYRHIVLAYEGGKDGRIAVLHQYQRQIRKYLSERDGIFLSNTWGDRSQDGRIREDFLFQEIDAAKKLGVDVLQIDDGWQQGLSANSVKKGGVWEGFWASDPHFWDSHPERLPNGLTPILDAAKKAGLKVGLWFAPDSSRQFANWEKDADKLIELHQKHGICYFKIDGVKAESKLGEKNLLSFFKKVLDVSSGKVVFDLDITAQIRPGYFGIIECGPIFVENRYTDWHNYWPHQTLRTLWKLSHYIDPVRLRMEFLNQTRNTQKYANDPLAPSEYSPAYLYASVMACSTLGWFEVSNLPKNYFDEIAPLAKIWKQHRHAYFSGVVQPIGECPDGKSLTGFRSISKDGKSAYLLLFREMTRRSDWMIELPITLSNANVKATILAGSAAAKIRGSQLTIDFNSEKSFALVQLA